MTRFQYVHRHSHSVIQNHLIHKHEQRALISLITEEAQERNPRQHPRCLKQKTRLFIVKTVGTPVIMRLFLHFRNGDISLFLMVVY